MPRHCRARRRRYRFHFVLKFTVASPPPGPYFRLRRRAVSARKGVRVTPAYDCPLGSLNLLLNKIKVIERFEDENKFQKVFKKLWHKVTATGIGLQEASSR